METLPQLAEADLALPDMAVGIYDWAAIADHQLQTLTLLSYGDVEQRWRWLTRQTAPAERPFALLSGWRANMSRRQYGESSNVFSTTCAAATVTKLIWHSGSPPTTRG